MFLCFTNTTPDLASKVIINLGMVESMQVVAVTGENDGIHSDRIAVGFQEDGQITETLMCGSQPDAEALLATIIGAGGEEAPITFPI
jgi:phosphoenolpyruvate synthase/pyruvate phosphate dikinase